MKRQLTTLRGGRRVVGGEVGGGGGGRGAGVEKAVGGSLQLAGR